MWLFFLMLHVCFSGEETPPSEEIPVEIVSTTSAPAVEICNSIFLNTFCAANTTGSVCEVGCLNEVDAFNYTCNGATKTWIPESVEDQCPVDVMQFKMHNFYCEAGPKTLELEPQMSSYQCADQVASNPDCLTEFFNYIPFKVCKCVTNIDACRLEYTGEPISEVEHIVMEGVEKVEGQTTFEKKAEKIQAGAGLPTFKSINATDMYVFLASDFTCGEQQEAIQYCKECEWEKLMSLEECAAEVMGEKACSSIFSWRDENNEEENKCWCVPTESDGCHFEAATEYVTYTLTEHRDLVGKPGESNLKKFTLTMIVVIMVVTPLALGAGAAMHIFNARRKEHDDVLLDGKYIA